MNTYHPKNRNSFKYAPSQSRGKFNQQQGYGYNPKMAQSFGYHQYYMQKNQHTSSSKSSSPSSKNDSSSSDSSKSSKNYNKYKQQVHKNSSTIKTSKRSSSSSITNKNSGESPHEFHKRKDYNKDKKNLKRTESMPYYKEKVNEKFRERESFNLTFGRKRDFIARKQFNYSRSRSRSSKSRSKDRRKDRESRGRSYKVYGGFDNHRVMKPATNYLKKLEISKYNELQKKFESNDILLNKTKNKWDDADSPKIKNTHSEKIDETTLKNSKDDSGVKTKQDITPVRYVFLTKSLDQL